MAYDIRPLSFAEVLDRGFRVFRDHFWVLVGISACVWIPYGVLLALGEMNKAITFLGMLAFMIVSPLMYAAMIVAVADVYLGRQTSIGGAYRWTREIVIPIVGTFLLFYVFITLAFIALLIPGIYLIVCWALVAPVMIVERRFGMAALSRSRALVRDAWGRTFGILLVASLIAWVPGGVLNLYWSFIPYVGQILTAGTSAVVSTYGAVVLVIYYFDRRCRVEEFDLHFLAQQVRAEGVSAAAAESSTIA